MDGAGGKLNVALVAAGLVVLSSGLGLVAMRGRRR
jgi:LPXTG-motif cell wall-anchored protein